MQLRIVISSYMNSWLRRQLGPIYDDDDDDAADDDGYDEDGEMEMIIVIIKNAKETIGFHRKGLKPDPEDESKKNCFGNKD